MALCYTDTADLAHNGDCHTMQFLSKNINIRDDVFSESAVL